MFKIGPATYWWPVQVPVPKDGGEVEVCTFEAQYRYLDVDAHEALMLEVRDQQLDDRAFCRKVVSSFRGVSDERGEAVPFSADTLDALLRQPGAATAMTRKYFESRHADPALGNSQRPPAGGPEAALDTTTRH